MITDYISYEVLKSEGFVRRDDYSELLAALNMNGSMLGKRLAVVDVAEWLGIAPARLRRYIRAEHLYGREVMDADGKMTFQSMLTRDWSALTEKGKTYIKN